MGAHTGTAWRLYNDRGALEIIANAPSRRIQDWREKNPDKHYWSDETRVATCHMSFNGSGETFGPWGLIDPEEVAANAVLMACSPDLLAMLIQAIEESGHTVCGPTDWRAAEEGDPKWVCKARGLIARATTVPGEFGEEVAAFIDGEKTRVVNFEKARAERAKQC